MRSIRRIATFTVAAVMAGGLATACGADTDTDPGMSDTTRATTSEMADANAPVWDTLSLSKAGDQLDMHGRGGVRAVSMAKVSVDNARLATNSQGDKTVVADVTYQANDDVVHDAKLIHDKMVEFAYAAEGNLDDVLQGDSRQGFWLEGMRTVGAGNPFTQYITPGYVGSPGAQVRSARMSVVDGGEAKLDSVSEILQKVLVGSNGNSINPAGDQIGMRGFDSDGHRKDGFAYGDGALQAGFEKGGRIDRATGIGFTDDGHGEFTVGFGRSPKAQRKVADQDVSYLVTFIQGGYAVDPDAEGHDGWLLDYNA